MGDSLILYGHVMTTLCQVLKAGKGPHLGRLKTLGWCVVGLLLTSQIHIPQWATQIVSGAEQAASKERRLYRWLSNAQVTAQALYAPLIQAALQQWGSERLYLALDTTTLWNRFTIVYLSVIYRGRAVPLVWLVLPSASAMVAFETYKPLLKQAAKLLPASARVVLLADRAFCDVALLTQAVELSWSWRIRLKSNVWVYRLGRSRLRVIRLRPPKGQAHFHHKIWITAGQFGPVYLALAWGQSGGKTDPWYVVSDEPTDCTTFDEYGLRFDTEELFLDEKSANFHLTQSELRDAEALSRLALVLAVTVLLLVSWGTAAVSLQLRRTLDGHWLRGLSYLRIGWVLMRQWLAVRCSLPTWLYLSSQSDPEPACSSLRQFFVPGPSFRVAFDP